MAAGPAAPSGQSASRSKILIRVHLRSSAAKYSCHWRQPGGLRPSPGRTPSRSAAAGPVPLCANRPARTPCTCTPPASHSQASLSAQTGLPEPLAPVRRPPPTPPRPCPRKPACQNPLHLYAACLGPRASPKEHRTHRARRNACAQRTLLRALPVGRQRRPLSAPRAAPPERVSPLIRVAAKNLRPSPVHPACRAARAASSPCPPRWALPPDSTRPSSAKLRRAPPPGDRQMHPPNARPLCGRAGQSGEARSGRCPETRQGALPPGPLPKAGPLESIHFGCGEGWALRDWPGRSGSHRQPPA